MGSPGEGVGLSSLSGHGVVSCNMDGWVTYIGAFGGCMVERQDGDGAVGSANTTGAMPTDWSTYIAQSNNIDWHVSLSFAACFIVFTALFTSLGLPFLFLCTLLCVLLLADLASPHALTSLALLASCLMMFDSHHLDDHHCSSRCGGT
jgi:hypothetical protein